VVAGEVARQVARREDELVRVGDAEHAVMQSARERGS
jgi:hypothetical protein